MTDVEVGETRLPGVGWRYDIQLARGMTLLVVVEDTGRRHIVLAGEADEDPWSSVPMTESQALAVASLLTGARLHLSAHGGEAQRPSIDDLPATLVESVLVTQRSAIQGLPPSVLAERLGSHAEVLGVVCDETPQILEGDPARPLQVGDRVVVAARRAHRDEVLAALEQ